MNISENVIEGKLLKNQNTQIMCPWAFFLSLSKGQMTLLFPKVSPPTSTSIAWKLVFSRISMLSKNYGCYQNKTKFCPSLNFIKSWMDCKYPGDRRAQAKVKSFPWNFHLATVFLLVTVYLYIRTVSSLLCWTGLNWFINHLGIGAYTIHIFAQTS